jgi:hypothetical protein
MTSMRDLVRQILSPAAAVLVRDLESLSALATGWDSYSAAAPSKIAIQNGVDLVVAADKASLLPERVEPSAMGGVGVTFRSGENEVIVEFYNNGTAHALFTNERTEEMRTGPVRPGTDWTGLIAETKEFLHGK